MSWCLFVLAEKLDQRFRLLEHDDEPSIQASTNTRAVSVHRYDVGI